MEHAVNFLAETLFYLNVEMLGVLHDQIMGRTIDGVGKHLRAFKLFEFDRFAIRQGAAFVHCKNKLLRPEGNVVQTLGSVFEFCG